MSNQHEEKRMVSWYFAVLEKNSEGRYFAHIPDLPGVVASGEGAGDALQELSERAARYLLDLARHSEKIPEPRDYDQLFGAEKIEGQTVLVPVTVPGRAVKISISMNDSLLVQIDAAAAREGMTRSGFLAVAAIEKLESDTIAELTYSTQVQARDGSMAMIRTDGTDDSKGRQFICEGAGLSTGFLGASWVTVQPTIELGGRSKLGTHRSK